MDRITYLQGIARGAVLALTTCMVIFLAVELAPAEYFHNYLIAFLGGIATLFAALIALSGNRAQIAHASDMMESRRQARLRAAATLLPIALSSVCATAQANMRRHFHRSDLFRPGNYSDGFSEINIDAFSTIKECVEFLDIDPADFVSKIAKTYQVLHSRASDEKKPHLLEPHQEEFLLNDAEAIEDVIQWAMLYVLSEHLFHYARNGFANFSSEWDKTRVGSAMWLSGIAVENFPMLSKVYNDRLKTGQLGLIG